MARAYDAIVVRKAIEQIRDALATLSYASDGFHEDEAMVSLDALDYLEGLLADPRTQGALAAMRSGGGAVA